MVAWLNEKLFSLLGKVAHIKELHGVGVHTNITNKIAHLTISGLVQVRKKTVFKLRIVNLMRIVSNLLVDGYLESGPVPEDILELGLIDGHPLLVSVVKLGALKSVSVLSVEVFLLAKLSELLFNCLESHLVEDVIVDVLTKVTIRVAELVEECLLLCWGEVAEDWHQRLEGLFVFLKTLMLSLREEVENADEALELS